MDKALEELLRAAINKAQDRDEVEVKLPIYVAKRFLYRLIKENSKPIELEYRKKEKKS